jgi:hypothetical protein
MRVAPKPIILLLISFPRNLYPEMALVCQTEENSMQNNQQVLTGVILMLVIVIGMLVYERHNHEPTLGEKVGETIDRATGEIDKR